MRIRTLATIILGLGAIVATTGKLPAAPVTYTITAIATGTVDSTPFTDSLLTIQGATDTDTITFDPSGFYFTANFSPVTLSIAGFGTATFTNSGDFFVNPNPEVTNVGGVPTVGYTDSALNDLLYNSSVNYAAYDLSSSISQAGVANLGGDTGGQFVDVPTSLGSVTVTSVQPSGTFQAVVPEPGAGWLLFPAAAGLLALKLNRRRTTL